MHLILIFLLIYITVIMIDQRRLMKGLQTRKAELEIEIGTLERDISQLNKEIENSGSLEFVEKVAREELGMVKPRERVYIDKNKLKNSFFNVFNRGTNWHMRESNIYLKWKYF